MFNTKEKLFLFVCFVLFLLFFFFSKKFNDLKHGSGYKKKLISITYQFLYMISNNDVENLIISLINHLQVSKHIIISSFINEKHDKIMNNICQLYNSIFDNDIKVNLLKLIINEYKLNELIDIGFNIGKQMYATTNKFMKTNNNDVIVTYNSKKRGRQQINQNIKEQIKNACYNNSREAANRYLKKHKTNARILNTPISHIWNETMSTKVSLSSFYKYSLPELKKGYRRTDLCPICEIIRKKKKVFNS